MRLVLLLLVCVLPASARADNPVVRITTAVGAFDVELCDAVSTLCLAATPIAVANFLGYVDRGDFDGTFFHRSIASPPYTKDFIIQGGAFYFDENIIKQRTPGPTIVNEFDPINSNRRGTIAMAKLGDNPDSATNQWFINLNANGEPPPNGLDYQNGGFTVFGVIVGNGMTVVDLLAAVPPYNMIASQALINLFVPYVDPDALVGNFASLPLLKEPPLTAADLPVLNTLAVFMTVTRVPEPGAAGGVAMIALLALAARRRGR